MNDQTAASAAWVDGDPLMEAIAAAVWEHCDTSGGYSIVTDDPRNIAAVAAHVARAAVLLWAAGIAESLRQFEPATGARKSAQISENVGILRVAAELRRLAGEAQQDEAREAAEYARALATPPSAEAAAYIRDRLADRVREAQQDDCTCGVAGDAFVPAGHYRDCPEYAREAQQNRCSARPCNADAGELCDTHAQQHYHAKGEHTFCGPECDSEAQQDPTQDGEAAPDDQTSLAAGLRAAAAEIAGLDFHPKARARSLDVADGLYRRLSRMADELQPASAQDSEPEVCGAREPEPRTGTSPCVLPAGHGGTKHQDKWTNQWPIAAVTRPGQPETEA